MNLTIVLVLVTSGISSCTGKKGKTSINSLDLASLKDRNSTLSNEGISIKLTEQVAPTYPHAVSKVGGTKYFYNTTGNLIGTSAGLKITYDGSGQVAKINNYQYTYAPGGILRKQINPDGSTTIYPFVDDVEVNIQGNVQTVTTYISIADQSGFGLPVAKVTNESSDKKWLHTDLRQSVTNVTNQASEIVESSSYTDYGSASNKLATVSKSYTSERGANHNLLYLHARFYDPQIGRFISPDALLSQSSGIGFNAYSYAENSPINASDRSGLLPNLLAGDSRYNIGSFTGRLDRTVSPGPAPFLAQAIYNIFSPLSNIESAITSYKGGDSALFAFSFVAGLALNAVAGKVGSLTSQFFRGRVSNAVEKFSSFAVKATLFSAINVDTLKGGGFSGFQTAGQSGSFGGQQSRGSFGGFQPLNLAGSNAGSSSSSSSRSFGSGFTALFSAASNASNISLFAPLGSSSYGTNFSTGLSNPTGLFSNAASTLLYNTTPYQSGVNFLRPRGTSGGGGSSLYSYISNPFGS